MRGEESASRRARFGTHLAALRRLWSLTAGVIAIAMAWESPPAAALCVLSPTGVLSLGLLAFGLRPRHGEAAPEAPEVTEKSSLPPKQAAESARVFQRRGGSFAYD